MVTKEKASEFFLSLVEENKGILYKVANAYCKDADDRQDLIQEILVQLWKSYEKYDDQYKHSTWIYRIALNVAISMYRKEHRRKKIANPITDNILYLADISYNNELDIKVGLLHQFISELKELDKALMLLYLEQKSHKEIAEIMDISETNVATKVSRIKEKLKKKFSQTQNQSQWKI
ncbi:RNA polymerase sigma-70 factor, ECF subfamily [Chitinophaga sp. CF118]|uniref:RNA polymerase sigma factor n=1 Tax=Chitinophaga sp. CF118 TaxID=1884367 RepID=UPI0008E046DE|nr:RNA polymerase sigma factor [Chitinophaga sp. CF118]SFD97980.1 RNA polymerase sigma-70 factor, ECF subfamily [Chitinophaga sp. CF118]